MRHDDWKERISRRFDGELSADETKDVVTHLASCADCRAYAEDLKTLRHAIRDAAELDLDPSFAVSVVERARYQDARVDSWVAVERLARNAVMGLALTAAILLATLTALSPRESASEHMILSSVQDTTITGVLMKPDELTKSDVLLAVVTR